MRHPEHIHTNPVTLSVAPRRPSPERSPTKAVILAKPESLYFLLLFVLSLQAASARILFFQCDTTNHTNPTTITPSTPR